MPKKTNSVHGIPESANAAVIAEAPGIDVTRSPAASAFETRNAPGSAMTGVPASETNATS
jgi:hypothetical protein